MKIYFAGSIRGGRQDAALYRQIIGQLKEHGQVLTEHVGEDEVEQVERRLSDEEIYTRDMGWLEEADVLIAEVTVPSHGVGYEIARAESLDKPILCLHRSARAQRLSALIAGNPNVVCEGYQRVAQLSRILRSFFLDHEGHPTEQG